MKTFLFLFPTAEFIDFSTKLHEREFVAGGCSASYLNDLIASRYRQNQFRIAWLLFSRPGKPWVPDRAAISEFIHIETRDVVIPCGISFKEMRERKVYPVWRNILRCFNRQGQLVLGGFHATDCVERLAKAAYERGYNVRVDEDLTEIFFAYTALYGYPPPQGFSHTIEKIKEAGGWLLEIFQIVRKNQPWLVKI